MGSSSSAPIRREIHSASRRRRCSARSGSSSSASGVANRNSIEGRGEICSRLGSEGLILFERRGEECVHEIRQNGRLAAEISVQGKRPSAGNFRPHRVEDGRIGPPKTVNRLFRVADDEQLSSRRGRPPTSARRSRPAPDRCPETRRLKGRRSSRPFPRKPPQTLAASCVSAPKRSSKPTGPPRAWRRRGPLPRLERR